MRVGWSNGGMDVGRGDGVKNKLFMKDKMAGQDWCQHMKTPSFTFTSFSRVISMWGGVNLQTVHCRLEAAAAAVWVYQMQQLNLQKCINHQPNISHRCVWASDTKQYLTSAETLVHADAEKVTA